MEGRQPELVDMTCSHEGCKRRGEYLLPFRCTNCGLEGLARLTRAHDRPLNGRCPECDCKTVRCEAS
jgi:hypothetical protein